MLFPTVDFALFFLVVFTLNWLLRPRYTAWRLFMIGASFFFYAYWDARFVFLLGGSVLGNWLFSQFAGAALTADGEKTRRSRALIAAAVAANLGVLAWFKYYGFLVESVRDTLDSLPGVNVDPPFLDIILPVGISFFTFQALSYVIDVGRGRIRPMTLLDFAVYLSFFPQLVAGPIVRATEFAPQLRPSPDPRRVQSAEAFRLIAAGLFKKVVISSYVATEIVDPVFAVPGDHSALEVLLAIYGYAVQIYADFSGYTDIAIGCALLLGFRFPQNFNAPYVARSVQDFWRRWHMTLSRWLRDYLYIPLGGNRRGRRRTSINVMITMLLGGLWHGAAWNFVIWGGIHGTALILERRIKERWEPIGLPSRVVAVLQWLVTFNVVCLAWVFFRAENLDLAFEMLGQLLAGLGEVSTLVTPLLLLVIFGSIAAQFVPERSVVRAQDRFSRFPPIAQGVTLGIALALIDSLGPEGVAPFIYFQF